MEEMTIEDRLAKLETLVKQLEQPRVPSESDPQNLTTQNAIAALQEQNAKLLDRVEALEMKLATAQLGAIAPGGTVLSMPKRGGMPSTEALIHRLEKHGIRVSDEDECEVGNGVSCDGSGSERWPSNAWTEARGEGRAYPGDEPNPQVVAA